MQQSNFCIIKFARSLKSLIPTFSCFMDQHAYNLYRLSSQESNRIALAILVRFKKKHKKWAAFNFEL